MYYIEFCAGQCKKRFTAYLSTASSHNYCSRKQANEFQRLLNIQPESIPSYKVKDATGRIQEIHEKIIVPVIFYFSNAKKANIKLALIPKENEQQLERLRNENKSPEDDDFKVIMVEHINEGIKYVFAE